MNPVFPGAKVGVFVFRPTPEGVRFLALQRPPDRNSEWHPVTGSVERGETSEQAAYREVEEETGIVDTLRLIDTGYQFAYDRWGAHWTEHVYGLEVTTDAVTLSDEHAAFRWVPAADLRGMLVHETQRTGLDRLLALLP